MGNVSDWNVEYFLHERRKGILFEFERFSFSLVANVGLEDNEIIDEFAHRL